MTTPKPRHSGRHPQSPSTRRTGSYRSPAAAASHFLRIVFGQLVAYLLHDWLG